MTVTMAFSWVCEGSTNPMLNPLMLHRLRRLSSDQRNMYHFPSGRGSFSPGLLRIRMIRPLSGTQ